MKKVVVTGANGHLGYTLVKSLKERGYDVRATVRNPLDAEKTEPLQKLGVEVVQVELTDPSSLDRALEGREGLFQVAAVFQLVAENPEESVIRPNMEGTRNILEAAHRAGIQRVVYTSSIASVGTVAPGEAPLDESRWNDRAVEPYAISKTRSEQAAWELSRKLGIPMVTVLPGTIIGPHFHRLTSSLQLVQDLLEGKVPMALPMSHSYVDVRDVALAHILVYENSRTSGRYIATGETLSMAEVMELLRTLHPRMKGSARVMPAWLARTLPALDYLQHKLTGSPRQMKRDLLREYLSRSQSYNSTRLREETGWSPRSVRISFQETIDWMHRGEESSTNGETESQKSGREGLS